MHTAEYRDIDGQVAFVERWPGPGDTVLCIHTAGQSGAQYRRSAPSLALHGFDVVVVDLPGHGRSDPVPSGPIDDLSWYATWCVALLRDLDARRVWALGCSIGGAIALDIATRSPTPVRGVIALDPSGVLGGADGWVPRSPLLEDSGSPSMRDRTYLGTVEACGTQAPPALVEQIATLHCREDWHVTVNDIHGAFTHDIHDRLGEVACPVYLACGADDYFVPPQRVRRIADAVGTPYFEVLPGVGHYPIEEIADVGALVAGWIEQMERDRG